MRSKIYLFSLSAFMFLGCGSGGSATYSAVSYPQNHSKVHSKPYQAPKIDNALKQTYLEVINQARSHPQQCGSRGYFAATTDLRWSDALYRAAYEHSNDLAQTNTFDHRGSGDVSDHTRRALNLRRGSTLKERIENNGYINAKVMSENITAGTVRDTVQKAVDAWLASDGHCANLMNPDFKEVGMAHVGKADTTYTHYWTQNLAKSR